MSNNATSKIGTMAETYYRLVAIDGSLRRISYYMKGILEDKRDRYYTDSFSASALHEPPTILNLKSSIQVTKSKQTDYRKWILYTRQHFDMI